MKVCCVEGCDGPNNDDPVFFEFPTSRLLRKRWLDAINSSTKVSQDAVICILHFGSEDYELIRGKTRLKSKVVPILRVGDKAEDNKDVETILDKTKSVTSDRTSNDKTTEKGTNNKNNDNGNNAELRYDDENNEVVSKDNEDNGGVSKDNKDNEKIPSQNKSTLIDTEKDSSHSDSRKISNENGNDSLNNNDNGKMDSDNGGDKNNEVTAKNNRTFQNSRKTRCKITAMRVVNGRRSSQDSDSSSQDSITSSPPHKPEVEGSKEDIEDALINYIIENKKTERQVAAMTDVLQEELERRREEGRRGESGGERWGDGMFQPSEPVFIELSVGQGTNPEGQAAENDCLMVLESVQCDVDPALLLASREDMDEDIEQVEIGDDDDDDDAVEVVKKKEDPISLLTSSDDDDVIIQEPKIDTVEVSSADTSEDDMPLVKLVKTPRSSKSKEKYIKSKRHKNLITKLLWGGNDFYCVHCRFTTADASEYTKHMATHSKVLQLCQDCGFATCSKAQMIRHKQKHKNERRFKCHRCNYSAKHEMSLVYHMKAHSVPNEVELAICDTFEPTSKMSRVSEKSKASEMSRKSGSDDKKHKCPFCGYKTNRRSDLKRHKKRLHHDDDDDDDDEYVP